MSKYLKGTILLFLISTSAYFGIKSFLESPEINELKLVTGGVEMNQLRDSLSIPLIEDMWVLHELDTSYAMWAARNKSVTQTEPMHLDKVVNYDGDKVISEEDAFHYEGTDSIAYRIICSYDFDDQETSFRFIEYYKGQYPPTKGYSMTHDQADSVLLEWGFGNYYSQPIKVVETFKDSLQVGVPGENKLVATQYEQYGKTFMRIELFSGETGAWKQSSDIIFEKDPVTLIDGTLIDLNRDGYNDFMAQSDLAARGSNAVRNAYLYDPSGGSLKMIRNSKQYPNLRISEPLDCVTSLMFHGCSSQAFLRVEGDSLKPFAWIYLSESLKVFEVNDAGEETILRYDSVSPYDCYNYFETYNPLVLGNLSR